MTQSLKKSLREYTTARVGLTRAGPSLATQEVLDFQLAHALARDAVHAAIDVHSLLQGLGQRSLAACALQSRAKDRSTYLRHPELGRLLSAGSETALIGGPCDIALAIADGLSALAVSRHALPLLDEALPLLRSEGLSLGPICVVEQGRVAIGDAVGVALGAKCSVVLIGERPGLSSPDSLGVYITWGPRVGRNDAERNCISNIRPEGLSYAVAAKMLAYYVHECFRQQLTGVGLKLSAALPGK